MTGFTFAHGTVADVTSPVSMPLHLLAADQPDAPGADAPDADARDTGTADSGATGTSATGASPVAAQNASVLFQNAGNPGDPQVQEILKSLPHGE